jgi:hypothetical protein
MLFTFEEGIPRVKRGYWYDNTNCRQFFLKLAATKQFDPLDASKWESIKYSDIQAAGVCLKIQQPHTIAKTLSIQGSGMLYRFGFCHRRAIMAAFPELEFSEGWKGKLKPLKVTTA